MSKSFIYGLWGSPELSPRRAKTLTEVERWLHGRYRPEPWEVYVYGEENQDWLSSRGIPCIMLDPAPLVDFFSVGGPPEPWGKGQMVWKDCSIWRHKTVLLSHALRKHTDIVWLDWDTSLQYRLPDGFWHRLASGQPIQMSLVQYKRMHCHWRPRNNGRRIVPEGAFIYLRGRHIASRANRRYAKHREMDDQAIFASIIDEMMGGWKGADTYKAMGFEPYCHRIYSQIHRPETVLFRTGGRIRLDAWYARYGIEPCQVARGGSPSG